MGKQYIKSLGGGGGEDRGRGVGRWGGLNSKDSARTDSTENSKSFFLGA